MHVNVIKNKNNLEMKKKCQWYMTTIKQNKELWKIENVGKNDLGDIYT